MSGITLSKENDWKNPRNHQTKSHFTKNCWQDTDLVGDRGDASCGQWSALWRNFRGRGMVTFCLALLAAGMNMTFRTGLYKSARHFLSVTNHLEIFCLVFGLICLLSGIVFEVFPEQQLCDLFASCFCRIFFDTAGLDTDHKNPAVYQMGCDVKGLHCFLCHHNGSGGRWLGRQFYIPAMAGIQD